MIAELFLYVPYFLFLSVPALMSFDREWRGKPEFVFAATLVIAVIAGFRTPGVDRDYLAYVGSYFRNLPPLWRFFSLDNLLRAEPGIRLIGSAFRGTIGLPISYTFAFIAVLSALLKATAFRKVVPEYFCLAIVIYLSNFFLLHEMTQIRIGLASAFFLLSIPDVLAGRRGRFHLKILAAVMFHYSAVFFLFVYPLRHTRPNLLRAMFVVVLAGQLMTRLVLPWVFESSPIRETVFARLGSYVFGQLSAGTINFANPLVWFRLGVLFLLHGPFKPIEGPGQDRIEVLVTNMYTVGTILFFGLYSTPVLALRLSQLFFVVDPIAIPLLLSRLLNQRDANSAVVASSIAFLAGNLFVIRLVGPFRMAL